MISYGISYGGYVFIGSLIVFLTSLLLSSLYKNNATQMFVAVSISILMGEAVIVAFGSFNWVSDILGVISALATFIFFVSAVDEVES